MYSSLHRKKSQRSQFLLVRLQEYPLNVKTTSQQLHIFNNNENKISKTSDF